MMAPVLWQELLKEVGETAGVSAIPARKTLYSSNREQGNSSKFDFKTTWVVKGDLGKTILLSQQRLSDIHTLNSLCVWRWMLDFRTFNLSISGSNSSSSSCGLNMTSGDWVGWFRSNITSPITHKFQSQPHWSQFQKKISCLHSICVPQYGIPTVNLSQVFPPSYSNELQVYTTC